MPAFNYNFYDSRLHQAAVSRKKQALPARQAKQAVSNRLFLPALCKQIEKERVRHVQ
jgi:hypothetical protein